MPSLREDSLCLAREEALSAVPYRIPFLSSLRIASVLNLGRSPLFLARGEAFSPEPESGPLCRALSEALYRALCDEPGRRPPVSSLRGGPLCRAREEALCV